MSYIKIGTHSKLDCMIINLKVLTKVERGDRVINRNGYLIRQPKGISQAISRWMQGDDRYSTLEAVQAVVREFLDVLVEKTADKASLRYLQKMFPDLLSHLTNLMHTYKGDTLLESSYELLLEKLKNEAMRYGWMPEEEEDPPFPRSKGLPQSPDRPPLEKQEEDPMMAEM